MAGGARASLLGGADEQCVSLGGRAKTGLPIPQVAGESCSTLVGAGLETLAWAVGAARVDENTKAARATWRAAGREPARAAAE